MGPILFNISISNIDGRIKCTLSKFANDIELSDTRWTRWHLEDEQAGEVDPGEPHEVQQGLCKVLHMSADNPYYSYRVEEDVIEGIGG